jgi:hypothetical protein
MLGVGPEIQPAAKDAGFKLYGFVQSALPPRAVTSPAILKALGSGSVPELLLFSNQSL